MATYRDLADDVLGPIARLPELEVPITDALGCCTAAPVFSAGPIPGYNQAIWEGVALNSDDVASASDATPVILPVMATIAAGAPPGSIPAGHCARVAANAAVPAGADAVVPANRVVFEDGKVLIEAAARGGEGLRAKGSVFAQAAQVVPAGEYLSHIQIAELALVGQPRILVHPRPRVVIVTIGSELTRVSSESAVGKVYDATGVLLTTTAGSLGADSYRVGPVPDDPGTVLDVIEDQLVRADVVITAGGIDSEDDVVRKELVKLGFARFDGPPMEPAVSYGVGRIGPDETPIIALPGDAALALLAFHALARPVITAMVGRAVQPTRRLPLFGTRVTTGSKVVAGRVTADRFVPIPTQPPSLAQLRDVDAIAIQHAHEPSAEVVEWPY